MKKVFCIILAAALSSGCSSSNDATKALDAAGYTNIQITGWRMFGCSDDDSFSTGFTALGPNGKYASGVVCSAWFKGSTIRLD